VGCWRALRIDRRLCGVIDLLLCAVIDWQRGWCKTVGSNDLGRLSDAQWLLAWVNQGLKEMQETGMPDPLFHSFDLLYPIRQPPCPLPLLLEYVSIRVCDDVSVLPGSR
jgi:hypothetical protein